MIKLIKHTPPPWTLDGDEITQGGKWTSDQDDIAFLNLEVACHDGSGFGCGESAHGNGLIMAKAHEMAAAIVGQLNMIEKWRERGEFGLPADFWEKQEQLRAAVEGLVEDD